MKILKGDTVLVISGKDKGKKGTVLRVLTDRNRLVVAGVNMRTKFMKKTVQSAGSKIQFEAALPAANVMLLDPKSGKPTRVGYKIENGKKVRVAKVSGAVIGKVAKVEKSESKTEKKDTTTKKKTAKKDDVATEGAMSKPTKAPFWKKMGFGADAMNEEPDSHAQSGPDFATPPSSAQHTRGASRGS